MSELRTFSVWLFTATACLFYPSLGTAASDAELEALRAQLQALTERLNQLEAEQAKTRQAQNQPAAAAKPAVPGEGEAVVGGALPGSFKLPGTNTSVKFGGYVKADAISDLSNAHGNKFANFATVPLDGSVKDQQGNKFTAHARQTRLNMQTSTPTDLGNLKTYIEVDFFGGLAQGNPNTTNGEALQLRHAYGELGPLLVGQTWSNFMNMDAYPESLDYIGPAGLSFVRQTQLRYSGTIDDAWSYTLALESPNSDFSSTVASDVSLDDVPDVTGRLKYQGAFGHLALHGMGRKMTVSTNTLPVQDDSAPGWGLGLSGKIKTWEKDSISFMGAYGEGIGRYLFDVAVSGNGSTFRGADLDPQTAYGGYLNYQHYWTDAWRSNLIGGYTGMDNDTMRTGLGVNKQVASGHINLIWQPVSQYRVGLEYMHGYRELESGAEGQLDRVQGSFMYLF